MSLKAPRFYVSYHDTSQLLNPLDGQGSEWSGWSAVLDYKVSLGLLHEGQPAMVELTLIKDLLESKGITIRKGHKLQVRAGPDNHLVFMGSIVELKPAADGTTLDIRALPLDHALKSEHPALVDALQVGYLTIGKDGSASISGHVHVVKIAERSGAADNPGCWQGSRKFCDGINTLPHGQAHATLLWHESPIYKVDPSGKVKIALARKDDTATVGDAVFYVDIYQGRVENPDQDALMDGEELDTWPWQRRKRQTYYYKNLKAWDDCNATADNSYLEIGLGGWTYSGMPYFIVVQAGDYDLGMLMGQGTDCKLTGKGQLWSSNISDPNSSPGDDSSGQMYGWDRPKPAAIPFSQFYDPDSDTTHIRIKQDATAEDSIKAQVYYYTKSAEATMRLFQRLLWATGYWPLMRTYYPDIYGPGKSAELTVRTPLGSIPEGTAMDTLAALSRVQGWLWLPGGYDPLGIVSTVSYSPHNAGHPVFYDQSKLQTISLSADDILERSIIDRDRPDPATMFIFQQQDLGKVQMPLLYEDISLDRWLKELPLYGQVKMSTDNLEALAEAVARWVEMDADGGTMTLKDHHPEVLGQYVQLPGGATFQVRALQLNPDMTTTTNLSPPVQTIKRSIQALTYDFKDVEPEGGTVSMAVWGHTDVDLDSESLQWVKLKRWSLESQAIYLDGVRLRKLTTATLADGSKVAYYLLTYEASAPLRWMPQTYARDYYVDLVEDLQHYPVLNGPDNLFYSLQLVSLQLHLSDGSELQLNVPYRPLHWWKRRFNITIALHY